ncbi:MAG: sugar phosphate isomerase/epimerase family protein [Clostridiales bacterium]|nr:sugar phosphate isomerase/epimerase family protein [Clostridiales bacterium]HBM81200.1 xylulose 5-phosphate 3-epimerase [Clostridiaceae bacterium]
MKKAVNIWSFKEGTPIKKCILAAKEAGYEGIELALNESGELGLECSERELLDIKSFAKEVGIELPSFATGLYWKYSFTSSDKSIREKAKYIAKKQLEFAATLGADTILVVPGAVGVDFIPGAEVVSYDRAYDLSLEAINDLKDDAEKCNIAIGIENVWNKFLLSPLETRDFIDKIGSDFVGVYFDVGNVIYTGYPEQWIRILGKRIKKVHFKDFRRNAGNIGGFVDLLEGDVNFAEVVKALKEIGYTDYVTAEMSPYKNDNENQVVINTSLSMDKILERKKGRI